MNLCKHEIFIPIPYLPGPEKNGLILQSSRSIELGHFKSARMQKELF